MCRATILPLPLSNSLRLPKGHSITQIVGRGNTRQHALTRFAKVVDGELRYLEVRGLASLREDAWTRDDCMGGGSLGALMKDVVVLVGDSRFV